MRLSKEGRILKKDFQDLDKVVEYLKSIFINRDDEIHAIILALLLGQHVLLTGPTGTGKSYLASQVFSCIKDASVFKSQLFKEMTGDGIIGPMDIKKYRDEGIVEYRTEGMLPSCKYAFLDEFMDANDNVLRRLLECLNEREFSNGSIKEPIPLLTAIAATNFKNISDNREAVIDRFLFRVTVVPLSSLSSRVMMLSNHAKDNEEPPTISGESLDRIRQHVKSVLISKSGIINTVTLCNIYLENLSKGKSSLGVKHVSDRRLCWALKVLQASVAWRNAGESNSFDITIAGFESLRFAFCNVHVEKEDVSFMEALASFEAHIENEQYKKGIEDKIRDFTAKYKKLNKKGNLAGPTACLRDIKEIKKALVGILEASAKSLCDSSATDRGLPDKFADLIENYAPNILSACEAHKVPAEDLYEFVEISDKSFDSSIKELFRYTKRS